MKLLSTILVVVAAATGFHAQKEEPRRDWVDPATGHRVIRLSDEPGSSTLYFHDNAFSAAGDRMMLRTPKGIAVVDVAKIGSAGADAGHRQCHGPRRLLRPARPRHLSERRRELRRRPRRQPGHRRQRRHAGDPRGGARPRPDQRRRNAVGRQERAAPSIATASIPRRRRGRSFRSCSACSPASGWRTSRRISATP